MSETTAVHSAPSGAALSKALPGWWWSTGLTLTAGSVLVAFGAEWIVAAAALALHGLATLFVARQRRRHRAHFGYASQVTQARVGLTAVLAAALLQPELFRDQAWLMAAIALAALALDGVDGWLARRFDESSEFGARFDMEVDAALIVVLCLAVMAAGKVGPWVLAIGLMRYAFVAAARVWPWLAAPLPERFRRKLVCVWQVAALLIGLTPPVGPAMASALLGSALALLLVSFALDIGWLRRRSKLAESDCPNDLQEET